MSKYNKLKARKSRNKRKQIANEKFRSSAKNSYRQIPVYTHVDELEMDTAKIAASTVSILLNHVGVSEVSDLSAFDELDFEKVTIGEVAEVIANEIIKWIKEVVEDFVSIKYVHEDCTFIRVRLFSATDISFDLKDKSSEGIDINEDKTFKHLCHVIPHIVALDMQIMEHYDDAGRTKISDSSCKKILRFLQENEFRNVDCSVFSYLGYKQKSEGGMKSEFTKALSSAACSRNSEVSSLKETLPSSNPGNLSKGNNSDFKLTPDQQTALAQLQEFIFLLAEDPLKYPQAFNYNDSKQLKEIVQ